MRSHSVTARVGVVVGASGVLLFVHDVSLRRGRLNPGADPWGSSEYPHELLKQLGGQADVAIGKLKPLEDAPGSYVKVKASD